MKSPRKHLQSLDDESDSCVDDNESVRSSDDELDVSMEEGEFEIEDV